MSRSIARILVIAIVCLSVALLAGKTLAAARGNSPVWTTSGPGSAISQSGPDASSPIATPASGPDVSSSTGTPANGSIATQDADGNGAADADTPGSEGSEAGEQNANDGGEQEIAGSVASVNIDSYSFTLTTATGAVVFAVTSQTEFEDGLTGLSSLHQGMNVQVDSVPQSAGHLLAVDVKGPSDTGAPENSNDSSTESNP